MTTSRAKGVTVVDLDHTLVLENSFHLFCRLLWVHSPSRVRVRLLSILARRRKDHAYDRVDMKRDILRVFSDLPSQDRDAIAFECTRRLLRTTSEPVLRRLRTASRRDDHRVLLATAAPDAYAVLLAEELGLDDCVATPSIVGPSWEEMFGQAKADACREWISRNVEPSGSIEVITDHADDLPLMLLGTTVVLQTSHAQFETIRHSLNSGISVDHIDPWGAQPHGGLWIWFDDRPIGPFDSYEVATILSKHRYSLMFSDRGWISVRAGDPLDRAVRRVDMPCSPSTRERMGVALRRRIIRDRLNIFH